MLVLRRLFSTFPSGWPGIGLLLQRLLTAALLLRFVVIDFAGSSFFPGMIPQIVCAVAGVLLLFGLWTPIAGGSIAAIELRIAITHIGDPGLPLLLATLGGTAAMIGPGAWSIDAYLFGRKHIDL